MILDGRLRKGDAVQELGLSKKLKVSRTPVREAISRLVAEGLLNRDPGQVPRVRETSIDDFIEILHIRRLLEVEAAGLAASRPDHETISRLRESLNKLTNTPNPSEADHTALDDDIHTSIANMTGSRLLVTMIRDLRMKTRFFGMERIPERFKPGCAEHLALLDAIDRGDVPGSHEAMRKHLDGVRASIMQNLQRLF
jgi:DNA-binding GntR family transcriptional regulator